MKKLLYILNDCMRRFSYERIAGLYQAIQRMDEPANLYIIRTDGHSAFAPEHNHGEYNIFRLPDYGDFDGILLDINSIYSGKSDDSFSESVLYAVKAARASGRPVISIANDLDDFYFMGIDNYAAMQSVIRHLHRVQGLEDFWFAMGPTDNFEAQQRARSLMDYCRDNGLPCGEERFYYESFTVECGAHAFEQLRARFGGTLPQAVICANDRIALGVCHAAETDGCCIPRDFMVTGFDNDDASSFLTPSITSVDQLCWNMGEACVDAMCRIWRGEALPRKIFTPTEIVLRESTGYSANDQSHQRKQIAEYVNQNSVVSNFSYKLSALQYRLPQCASIEEICLAFMQCVGILNIKGMRLILDSALFEYGRAIQIQNRDGRLLESADGLPTCGYSDTMELVFSWDAGGEPRFTRRRIGSHLDTERYAGVRENYLFAPLHFMEYTVGYFCVWDCVEMVRIHAVSTIVNALTVALRNFFTRKNLTYVNQVLSGISMKDDLTGLYNRLGYHNVACPRFRSLCEAGSGSGILFIDMDRLKYINDSFGHAHGDRAIQCVANAILHSIPENAVPIRYGGDEFMILLPIESEEQVRELLKAISAALPGEAKALGVPVAPEVSVGFVRADPNGGKSLDEYVAQADALMYRAKKEKKVSRTP